MLTTFDDFPVHQMPVPVAQTGTSDRNHYDRYFFNGYLPGGEVFFAAAMGLYPNRRVIDAAFSVVHDGVQRNVYASGRAPVERAHTSVGPVTVTVVRPMESLRLTVAPNAHGLAADLVFEARAVACEEERQVRVAGAVPMMDVTRFAQHGTWAGWIDVRGQRIEIDPRRALGTRDRSWGIRPVGEPPGGAPLPGGDGHQIFWLWGPCNFEDETTYIAIFDDAEGSRFYQHAAIAPVRAPSEPAVDPGGIVQPVRDTTFRIDWQPGTRRARSASMTLTPFGDAPPRELRFTVLYTFQMCGIGYSHPHWAHGRWIGEHEVGGDQWALGDVDPMAPQNLHIQNVCEVTLDGRSGWGILEQIAVGPHHPTGLTGLLDPYVP